MHWCTYFLFISLKWYQIEKHGNYYLVLTDINNQLLAMGVECLYNDKSVHGLSFIQKENHLFYAKTDMSCKITFCTHFKIHDGEKITVQMGNPEKLTNISVIVIFPPIPIRAN